MNDLATVTSQLHELLIRRRTTVATAESLTGGQVASALTSVGGASGYFLGGVVSYAAAVKQSVLSVPADVLAEHGTVSAPCAELMATGVRGLVGSQFGLSTTGVAGPEPAEGHRVGTVYVGVATPTRCWSRRYDLGTGSRAVIQERATLAALRLLLEAVGAL